MSWLDDARRPVPEVALALGLAGDARRGFACPACREERRDARRGAIGLRRDDAGWRCFRCDASGDAIDLASWHLGGARFRELAAPDRQAVRAWFSQDTPSRFPHPSPGECRVPVRPPRAEVEALWASSLPLATCLPDGAAPDASAVRFLRGRGFLDFAREIAEADLARLTPEASSIAWPSWWPRGRSETWRLIVRAWDSTGAPVSLHARATEEAPLRNGEPRPKQLWPRSRDGARCEASGLFFADPAGQRLLVGNAAGVRHLLLCEGLTDWLSAAAWCQRNPGDGYAVLGGVSGSFPTLAHIRLPCELDIVVGVDDDGAGDRYLAQIRVALAGRALRRLRLAVAA